MPIKTDLNVSPYFDDYDANNNYTRILFRPATAVQARELTQTQSILQNQVETFGNWAFRNGDIVEGCIINDLPVLPYVFLSDVDASNNAYDAKLYVGTTVVSNTSNLQAIVVYANVGYQANYPNSNILYVRYLNTGNNGATVFSNNELLQFYYANGNLIANNANVYTMSNGASTNTTGNAHAISVSNGIIYINGTFVKVTNTLIGLVNAYGVDAGNNVVGFDVVETIVTEIQDESLNDNALGYTNYNAPGAHRLKLTPTLVSLDPTTISNTANFNPIATFNYNAIVSKSTNSGLYSEINRAIATRTYEESGNYVVNPFKVDVISTTVDPNMVANTTYMYAKVSSGIGYAMGSRVAVDKAIYMQLRKGIDTQTFNDQKITFNYGSFFVIGEVSGVFEGSKAQKVFLYDQLQTSISSRKFLANTVNGNLIGEAKVRCFSYSHNGFPGTKTAYYTLNVFDVKMYPNATSSRNIFGIQTTTAYSIQNIKSIMYRNGGSPTGTILGVGDIASSSTLAGSTYGSSPYLLLAAPPEFLFTFGAKGLKNLRDASNNVHTQYTYRKTTSQTLTSNGNITVTLTTSEPGGTDTIPYGVGFLTAEQIRNIFISPTANALSSALTGTVNVSSSNTKVVATTALSSLAVGDVIAVANSSAGPNNIEYRVVESRPDPVTIYVDAPFNASNSAATFYKAYINGKNIFYSPGMASAYGTVNVTNSTSFTINLLDPPSSSLAVNVTYNVERTATSPAKKVIRKNRFVGITANSVNDQGPWCLGLSDVSKLSAIYAGNTYSISNQLVTNMFTFDTGQKDTHYDLAYLHLKPGMILPATKLLVQLDYFVPNTTPGVGFFTVESYPVDDANTANTNAIQSKDIGIYTTQSGLVYKLQDSVDFRPVANITAADTGVVDLTNSTSVSTALALISTNPSNTVSFTTPASGLNVPSYGYSLQSDYTQYLPRYDLVYVDPNNILKIKEGASAINPQPPLIPDNTMAVAQIYVPAYPSLSSDQVDELSRINKTCFSLCRDTTDRSQVTLLSNRVYTMRDIGKLDNRISNLEYYVQLSLLQQEATSMSSTDANGVERYKNGIFVDPFNDFSLCDVSNPEFNIAIDTQKGRARPKFIRESIKLQWTTFPDSYTNASPNNYGAANVNRGWRDVTLAPSAAYKIAAPTIISQKLANNSFSPIQETLNGFLGTMKLYPPFSSDFDINNIGSLNMTLNYSNPLSNFSGTPFFYTWGDWRINLNSNITSAAAKAAPNLISRPNIPIGQIASSLFSGQLYNTVTENSETPSINFITGSVSATFLGTRNVTPSVDAIPLTNVTYGGNSNNTLDVLSWAYGWT